jgi:hypothetical protein
MRTILKSEIALLARPLRLGTETIIVGAFETNRITATEWSRNLGRTAKRIMDAKDARREP